MLFSSRNKTSIRSRLRNLVWPDIGFRRSVRYLVLRLSRIASSPHQIALGFSIGVFAAFTPLLGLHFFLAAIAAFVARASVLAAVLGTVVGNPLTLPLMWAAAYEVGHKVTGGGNLVTELFAGGAILGLATAFATYLGVRGAVAKIQTRRKALVSARPR